MLDRQIQEEKMININEEWWFNIITNKNIGDTDLRVVSSLLCFIGKKKFKEVSVNRLSEHLGIPKEKVRLSIEHLKELNIIEQSDDRWSTGYRFTRYTPTSQLTEENQLVQEEMLLKDDESKLADKFRQEVSNKIESMDKTNDYVFNLEDLLLSDNELLILEYMTKYLSTEEYKILIQRCISEDTGILPAVVSRSILSLIQNELIEMRKIGKTNSYRINKNKLKTE